MTKTAFASHTAADADLAAQFARSLARQGVAALASRLEIRLSWPKSGDLGFEAEAALLAGLGPALKTSATHEVIWVLDAQNPDHTPWIEVRAFDDEGRRLLTERLPIC